MNLFCPNCRGEFREGISVCHKCNGNLVPFKNLPPILPYCPSCNKKYPVGTTLCTDCLIELKSEDIQEDEPSGELILDDTITVITNLDFKEAKIVNGYLTQNGIKADICAHGLYGRGSLYGIEIFKKDIQTATPFLEQAMKNIEEIRLTKINERPKECPKCQSVILTEAHLLSAIEHLKFVGCTVWLCERCGYKWGT
jgi:hypothetical protein